MWFPAYGFETVELAEQCRPVRHDRFGLDNRVGRSVVVCEVVVDLR